MSFNRLFALATSTALLTVGPPAFAQDAASGAEAADDGAVGEIIVTANKREERLQDVPISVSVVEGSQLTRQNINEVTDITRSTPALNSAGPYGALSIRGVGSISFARSAEGSVGVVVDGVALANTSSNPPQLFDVQRVEVLEGPQGTLFGRNSSAGLINIVTNDPDPSKVEAIAHVDVGTRSNYIGRAAINLPVSDNAALRVSGSYSRAPEVIYNRYDGSWAKNEGISGRARFKWEPISELTFNLIGDYSKFNRSGGAPWSVYYSTPGSKLSEHLKNCGVVVGQNNQAACIDGGHDVTYESYGFSGQVDAEIGDHVLTSISAYRAYKSDVTASDSDSVPVDRLNMNLSPYDVQNFSQELRLTSPSGGFIEYVAGLYYFDSELDSSNSQRGNLLRDSGL